MGNTKKDLQDEIKALEAEIADTKNTMAETLKMRNKEVAEFRQALKDDADAVALLKKAIVALSAYYKKNKIALGLAQKAQAPEYEQDPDKAPETSFSGAGSRKSESGGIVAILEMLVEDTEKEMKEGKADDADAQAKYLKVTGASQASLDAQEESKVSAEEALADLNEKMAAYEKFSDEKKADKDAEDDTAKSLATDCDWVKTNFESRRTKRKTEIQGLVDAKAFLAEGGSGI